MSSDRLRTPTVALQELADTHLLDSLLGLLQTRYGGYRLLAHWTQGEFHHDLVLHVRTPGALPGPVLVVSTNCNGGVKEVICFDSTPERSALWHSRCPDNPAFSGDLPSVLGRARTVHYFDARELLAPDARSELKPEHRRRQPGGGWTLRSSDGVDSAATPATGVEEAPPDGGGRDEVQSDSTASGSDECP